MRNRTVNFFAPSAYPLGGVADWLDYVLRGLSDLGWTCNLCLVAGAGHDPVRYLERHPWKFTGTVKNHSGSREGRIRGLLDALRRTEPDIAVSVNLVDVYEVFRRFRTRAISGATRVVMALHGLEACLIEDIRRERDVLDAVVATNRLSVAFARDAVGQASRSHYAAYGVPLHGSSLRTSGESNELRLLFAGRIEQEQKRVLDLPRILRALRQLGIDAHLSIAGAGPLESHLRTAFDGLEVTAHVHWLGDLDSLRLAQCYRSHDLLLITSEWETGPIVAWEAMSHGLPVVSSRYIGSGLEGALVDGSTALLFEVGDVEGAVRAVVRLLESEVRDSVVAGGYALVANRYSREASVQAWDRALTSVMNAPALPASQPRLSPPSGRLDRWMGVERAEDIRRLLGIRFVPDSPGAAWPHTGSSSSGQAAFLERARLIDRGVSCSP